MQYKPSEIEPKWQQRWEQAKVYKTPESLAELGAKPKFYVLDMFPYPSGAGLQFGAELRNKTLRQQNTGHFSALPREDCAQFPSRLNSASSFCS